MIYADTEFNRGCVHIDRCNDGCPQFGPLVYRYTNNPVAVKGHPVVAEGEPVPLVHAARIYGGSLPTIHAHGCILSYPDKEKPNDPSKNRILSVVEIIDCIDLAVDRIYVQECEATGVRIEGASVGHGDSNVKGFTQGLRINRITSQGNRRNFFGRFIKESKIGLYLERSNRNKEPSELQFCYDCEFHGCIGWTDLKVDNFTLFASTFNGRQLLAGELLRNDKGSNPFSNNVPDGPAWSQVKQQVLEETVIETAAYFSNCWVSLFPECDKTSVVASGGFEAKGDVEIVTPDKATTDRLIAFVRLHSDVNDAGQTNFTMPAGQDYVKLPFRIIGGWATPQGPNTGYLPRLILAGAAPCPPKTRITVSNLEVRQF